MKRTLMLLQLVVALFVSASTMAQTPASAAKMSVNDRMAKARAAKAEKRTAQDQPKTVPTAQ